MLQGLFSGSSASSWDREAEVPLNSRASWKRRLGTSSRLVAEFTRLLEHKPIHVLDIPDEYKYMDPELVELLEQSVGSLLNIE